MSRLLPGLPGSRRPCRGLVLALAAGLLAGCATSPSDGDKDDNAVPRPEWRVGDRWAFQRTPLGGTPLVVTHQVVSADAAGYVLRISGAGPDTSRRWTRELHLVQQGLPGGVTARFEPPVRLFQWPLGLGRAWTQEFAYTDGTHDGRYANAWRTGPAVEPIDVVGGRFYALRIERSSTDGQRLMTYWYSPLARYWVRLEDYQHGYLEELVEHRAWGG